MLAFEVLPKLAREVKSETVAGIVEEHLAETHEHAARVEQAFRALGAEPSSNLDAGIDGLRKQHDEQSSNVVGDRLADALHVAAAIRTEHAELALYDTLLRLAEPLGLDQVRQLLAANREEEQRALELLERELARLAGALASTDTAS
jgi:ferritin-like metal-binding protein YciE